VARNITQKIASCIFFELKKKEKSMRVFTELKKIKNEKIN